MSGVAYSMGKYGVLSKLEAYKVLIQLFQKYLAGSFDAPCLCFYVADACQTSGDLRDEASICDLVARIRLEMHLSGIQGTWRDPDYGCVSRPGRTSQRLEFAEAAVKFMQDQVNKAESSSQG